MPKPKKYPSQRPSIKSLEALKELVDQKRSVICPNSANWNSPRPAAFMINLPGMVLLHLFRSRMYIYSKPEKKQKGT